MKAKKHFPSIKYNLQGIQKIQKIQLMLGITLMRTDFFILKVIVYMAVQYFEWYSKSTIQIHKETI